MTSATAMPPVERRSIWRVRGRRTLAVVVTLAVAMSAFTAVIGLPQLWVDMRSSNRIHHVADAPSAPVALVLGAGLAPGGGPSPYLAGRLDRAKELYDAGRVQVILVSGDNRFANYDEPTAMQEYLIDHGVPEHHIVRDFAGRATYDSCVRAKRIFGVDRALVVSQTYHLPRAIALCRNAGVDAYGVGDETGRQIDEGVWRAGSRREVLANVKAAWHAMTQPDPVLGHPEPGVHDALTD